MVGLKGSLETRLTETCLTPPSDSIQLLGVRRRQALRYEKNGARVGLEHEDLRVGRHEDLHRARSDVAADVQIDPALYSYGRI